MSYPCNSQCKTKSVRLKIPNKVNHESGSHSNRDVENNLGNLMYKMEGTNNWRPTLEFDKTMSLVLSVFKPLSKLSDDTEQL